MPPNATNLPNKAYPAPAPPFATTPFSVAARLCRNSSWSTSQYWCPWNPAEIDKELQLSSAPWKKPRAGIIGASKKNVLNFVLPWKNPQLEPLEPPKKIWKGIWLIWTRPLWGAQQVEYFGAATKAGSSQEQNVHDGMPASVKSEVLNPLLPMIWEFEGRWNGFQLLDTIGPKWRTKSIRLNWWGQMLIVFPRSHVGY